MTGDDSMVAGKIQIRDHLGLHLRPAGMIAEEALKFRSSIELCCNGRTVTGKSLLSVLSLGVRRNDEVEVRCLGEDEQEALDTLLALMHRVDDEAIRTSI